LFLRIFGAAPLGCGKLPLLPRNRRIGRLVSQGTDRRQESASEGGSHLPTASPCLVTIDRILAR
jgi:hypothetical protein